MTNLAYSLTLSANTTAKAADVETKFTDVKTWLNNRDNASDYWLNMKVNATVGNPAEIKSSAATCELDIDCTGTNGTPIFTWRRSGATYFTAGVDGADSNAFKLGSTSLTTNIAFQVPSTGSQVQFTPGSASTPGISTRGDTTTGIRGDLSGSWSWISVTNKKGELTAQGFGLADGTQAAPGLYFFNDVNTGIMRNGADDMILNTGGTAGAFLEMKANGDIILTQIAPLATGATGGFVFIPTVAGTPTGAVTNYTGTVAMLYDTTAHKMWVRDGASWKSATFA